MHLSEDKKKDKWSGGSSDCLQRLRGLWAFLRGRDVLGRHFDDLSDSEEKISIIDINKRGGDGINDGLLLLTNKFGGGELGMISAKLSHEFCIKHSPHGPPCTLPFISSYTER
jgi:hypothetical protein